VFGFDPAYTGPCGIAILTRPTPDVVPIVHAHRSCQITDVATTRWLGDKVSEVCRPGERIVFVTEDTAFGGHAVARMLGIAVGIVEGLLVDLNALDPDSRVDVATRTWRAALPGVGNGGGRTAAKQRAVRWVESAYGITMPVDAAEAACIATWWSEDHPEWGTHERPIPVTPTGLRVRV
jgi:hypothetical protein